MTISTKAILAGVMPGEILYCKMMADRFGFDHSAASTWFFRLKRSGHLVKLAHGVYRVADNPPPVAKKAKAVRKKKPRKVPARPTNVVKLVPMTAKSAGIVQKAIASQPALAQAWGKMA
jgi:hypothetical protein